MGVTEAERRGWLAEAGWNLLRVPAARVAYDLFSDVPPRVLVPERDPAEAGPDDVRAALAPLCGDATLALATKGRAAEIALVDSLELTGPPVVLTHGLFSTTQAALARRGAVIEDVPLAQTSGASDLDVEALATRLARGGVHLVYLEIANNALGGWPLHAANVAAVRALCDRHGALFVLDAARPLANSFAAGDPVADARAILGQAHAFTISCAKECLVPTGSVVGSADAALIARVSQQLFRSGTSMSVIDPPQQRADLRDGARYILAHPELVRDRLVRVRELALQLAAHGVATLEPVTAHAVYAPIDRALLPAGDIAAMIALLSHLYVITGARTQVANTKRGPAIRFALPLATPLEAEPLARGVAEFFARIAERPQLRAIDGPDAPFFRRFAPA